MSWFDPTVILTSLSAAALAAGTYVLGRRSGVRTIAPLPSTQRSSRPAENFDVLDGLSEAALAVDAAGAIQYANQAAAELLGISRGRLLGTSISSRLAGDGSIASGSIGFATSLNARGAEIPVEVTRTQLSGDGANGQLLILRDRRLHLENERLICDERDILEAIAKHRSLEEIVDRIAAGVARVQTGLRMAVLIRREGVAQCLGGIPPESRQAIESSDATGMPPQSWWTTPRIFDDVQQDPAFIPSLAGLRAGGIHTCWSFPIAPPGGDVVGVLLFFPSESSRPGSVDISLSERCSRFIYLAIDREAMTARMATQSLIDPLTGLPNRMLATDRLDHALKGARRSGAQLATMLIDLDGFKAINDGMGNQNGDQLLKQVADRLKTAIRASDTLGRFGADQFILIASEIAEHSIELICERLLTAFKLPFSVAGTQMPLTASIGICMYPSDGEDVNALLRNTDTALAIAKRQRRGGYQQYEPCMNQAALEREEIENQLRTSLQKNELVVYYQPQVDSDGQVVAVEALLRWKRNGVLIAPLKFIPIAEESGLVIPIGRWVLEQSCRWCKKWQDTGRRPIRVAVNVSAVQFAQDDFVQVVRDCLASASLDPCWLEVEVTESLLMQHTRNVAGKLERLRDMGVAVAIDDFGTGYSSLSYLQKLPIDILKIDRSFVKDIPNADDHSSEKTAVIRAILSMAHSLQLKVVAEGVESDMHYQFLRRAGCHQMQGYYFSPPKPGDDLPTIVDQLHEKAGLVQAA